MQTVVIGDAETPLALLLARVEVGEEIILARRNEPIAKLVPRQAPPTKRRFGGLHGIITIGPAFFESLPKEGPASWK